MLSQVPSSSLGDSRQAFYHWATNLETIWSVWRFNSLWTAGTGSGWLGYFGRSMFWHSDGPVRWRSVASDLWLNEYLRLASGDRISSKVPPENRNLQGQAGMKLWEIAREVFFFKNLCFYSSPVWLGCCLGLWAPSYLLFLCDVISCTSEIPITSHRSISFFWTSHFSSEGLSDINVKREKKTLPDFNTKSLGSPKSQ